MYQRTGQNEFVRLLAHKKECRKPAHFWLFYSENFSGKRCFYDINVMLCVTKAAFSNRTSDVEQTMTTAVDNLWRQTGPCG